MSSRFACKSLKLFPWRLLQAEQLPRERDDKMKPRTTNRDRAYYRHHRKRVIYRKLRIAKQIHWHIKNNQWGRLAKGKIHCTCGLCSEKSRLLGYPKAERARVEGTHHQLIEYFKEHVR
jgi:hypothetical protein